jgi:hypothetical protein
MTSNEATDFLFQMLLNGMGTFRSTDIAVMWQNGQSPIPIAKWGDFERAVMALIEEHDQPLVYKDENEHSNH